MQWLQIDELLLDFNDQASLDHDTQLLEIRVNTLR